LNVAHFDPIEKPMAREPGQLTRAEAWARYRRLMRAMLAAVLVVLVLAFAWLAATGTPMSVHFVIAVSLGVAASLMLTAALMGLLFLSNSTGADDDARGD
jgi:hypothetical protein